MARQEQHPRQRLQEAGVRLFYEKGFHATTVRHITDACGLTPGALYNHFGSKEEVLYSIILDGHAALDDLMSRVPEDAPPAERLRGLIEAFVLHHTRHRMIALVGDEWKVLDEGHRKEIRQRRLDLRALYEDTIRAGVAAGEFTVPDVPGGDPVRLTVMATMDMAFRVAGWFDPDGPVKDTDFARFYAELMLRAVTAR